MLQINKLTLKVSRRRNTKVVRIRDFYRLYPIPSLQFRNGIRIPNTGSARPACSWSNNQVTHIFLRTNETDTSAGPSEGPRYTAKMGYIRRLGLSNDTSQLIDQGRSEKHIKCAPKEGNPSSEEKFLRNLGNPKIILLLEFLCLSRIKT